MHSLFRTTTCVAAAGAIVLTTCAFRYSGWGDAPSKATAAAATTWLKSTQLSDGSFETSGFPGFETPDAILAIAENAQQQASWNTSQALAAVKATTKNGHNPLHAMDDLVDAGVNAGQAAKLIELVVKPLGLLSTKFDPDNDGGHIDLRATVVAGKQSNGSYGTFNATLYAMIALRKTSISIGHDTIAYLRSTQEAGGGWNFAGDPTGKVAPADVDTTAVAIEALIAAKVVSTDTDVRQGLKFLATQYRTNTGAWQSFGADDPNSTSSAVIAVTAAGFDPASSCWRNTVAPTLKKQAYRSPLTWLR